MPGCITVFFFNDTATTEIYTLSLHDALPIYHQRHAVVSLPGPPAAAQDEIGATSEGTLWRTVRGRIRRLALRPDEQLCGRPGREESADAVWLLARPSLGHPAGGDRAHPQPRRLSLELRDLRRKPHGRDHARSRHAHGETEVRKGAAHLGV